MPPGIHQILLGLSHCHNNCPSYFSVLTKAREKGAGFALRVQGAVHCGKKVVAAHVVPTVQQKAEHAHIPLAFSFLYSLCPQPECSESSSPTGPTLEHPLQLHAEVCLTRDCRSCQVYSHSLLTIPILCHHSLCF